MLRIKTLILMLAVILPLLLMPATGSSQASLKLIRTFNFNKISGSIDQLIPLAAGFLVRDSNYKQEAAQAIELYDPAGRLVRKIGKFGKNAGEYYRLKSLAVDRNGAIWVADVGGAISRFSQDGKLTYYRAVRQPAFQPYGLALDQDRGVFYLSGCVPKQIYLDKGCQLVHQYSLGDGSYRRSYLDTDPEAVQKHLFSLEDYVIDIDPLGCVWAADGPIRKVFKLNPASGNSQAFLVRTRIAGPVAALNPKEIKDIMPIYEQAFLIERIIVSPPYVVVSIGQLKSVKFVLEVFSANGQQVAVDLVSPGRLVVKANQERSTFQSRFPVDSQSASTGSKSAGANLKR